MGTNFYWLEPAEPRITRDGAEYELIDKTTVVPSAHIGKRSAAGLYCWDCDLTLCKGGNSRIHYDVGFYDHCPRCKATPADESNFHVGPAALELGLAPPRPDRPTGVHGCSSFTWAEASNIVRQKV